MNVSLFFTILALFGSSFSLAFAPLKNGQKPISIKRETIKAVQKTNFEDQQSTVLELDSSVVPENLPAGFHVGDFKVTNANSGGIYRYSLVDGNGSADNVSFVLDVNGTLRTVDTFDYEALEEGNGTTLRIRVRVSNELNASLEKPFLIAVSNIKEDLDSYGTEGHIDLDDDGDEFSDELEISHLVDRRNPTSLANQPPSLIVLNSSSVEKQQPVGTVVGEFAVTDEDPEDAHEFFLVDGNGSQHNHLFNLELNGTLITAVDFDSDDNATLYFRVRVQDKSKATFEKAFSLSVITRTSVLSHSNDDDRLYSETNATSPVTLISGETKEQPNASKTESGEKETISSLEQIQFLETCLIVVMTLFLIGALFGLVCLKKIIRTVEGAVGQFDRLAGKDQVAQAISLTNEVCEKIDALPNQAVEPRQSGSSDPTKAQEADAGPDHSFPISVFVEIERMLFRLRKYDDSDPNKKPMSKALERLQRKLSELGYERIELLGKPYKKGTTCDARFIPSDNDAYLKPLITRVIKPHVNFEGKLVQIPEVEVTLHEPAN